MRVRDAEDFGNFVPRFSLRVKPQTLMLQEAAQHEIPCCAAKFSGTAA
jgi:hypothetical protein